MASLSPTELDDGEKKVIIYHESFIKKKSPSGIPGLRNWQNRYFVLTDKCLNYYKNKDDKEPLGTIPLMDIVTCEYLPEKRVGCRFDVSLKNRRVYALDADSPAAAKEWVQKIRQARQQLVDYLNKLAAEQKKKSLFTPLQDMFFRAKYGDEALRIREQPKNPQETAIQKEMMNDFKSDQTVLKYLLAQVLDPKVGLWDFDITTDQEVEAYEKEAEAQHEAERKEKAAQEAKAAATVPATATSAAAASSSAASSSATASTAAAPTTSPRPTGPPAPSLPPPRAAPPVPGGAPPVPGATAPPIPGGAPPVPASKAPALPGSPPVPSRGPPPPMRGMPPIPGLPPTLGLPPVPTAPHTLSAAPVLMGPPKPQLPVAAKGGGAVDNPFLPDVFKVFTFGGISPTPPPAPLMGDKNPYLPSNFHMVQFVRPEVALAAAAAAAAPPLVSGASAMGSGTVNSAQAAAAFNNDWFSSPSFALPTPPPINSNGGAATAAATGQPANGSPVLTGSGSTSSVGDGSAAALPATPAVPALLRAVQAEQAAQQAQMATSASTAKLLRPQSQILLEGQSDVLTPSKVVTARSESSLQQAWGKRAAAQAKQKLAKCPLWQQKVVLMLKDKDFVRNLFSVFNQKDQVAHGLAVRILWATQRGLHGTREQAADQFNFCIQCYCSGHSFSMPVKQSMFALLLQANPITDFEATLTVGFYAPIVHREVWVALFQSMRESDFEVRVKALEDITTLLHECYKNSKSLQRCKDWQNLIYLLLCDIPRNNQTKIHKQAYSFILNTITLVHNSFLFEDQQFYYVLCDSLAHLHNFSGFNNASCNIAHAMLLAMVNKLISQKTNFVTDTNYEASTRWRNLVMFFRLLRRYVFMTAYWRTKESADDDSKDEKKDEEKGFDSKSSTKSAVNNQMLQAIEFQNRQKQTEFILAKCPLIKADKNFNDYTAEPTITDYGIHWTDKLFNETSGEPMDLPLMRQIVKLFKTFQIAEFKADQNTNLGKGERDFLKACSMEYDFWNDAIHILSLLHKQQFDDHVITYRKLSFELKDFLEARSSAAREYIVKDLESIVSGKGGVTTPAAAPKT